MVCAGLISLLDVSFHLPCSTDLGKLASEVSERSQNIIATIDSLSFQLGRIQLVSDLPSNALLPSALDNIHFTAFKLGTAITKYLELAIEHYRKGFASKSRLIVVSNYHRKYAQSGF